MSRRFFRQCLAPVVAAAAFAATGPAFGEAQDFDFTDPKGVNALAISLDSELEPIVAIAGDLSGVVNYDPDAPAGLSGEIVAPVTGIQFANPRMSGVLQGANWLDAEQFGQIKFVLDNVQVATAGEDGVATLAVPGKILYGNLEIDKTIELRAHHLPDAAAQRGGAEAGDLLVLRTSFTVTREDFNLQPELSEDKVANEIRIDVMIVGYSQ
ncbi:MAG: YceI family protein [Planctomycetota bacterium]